MPVPTDPEKRKYMFSDDMKFLQKAVVFHPTNTEHFLIIRKSPSSFSHANRWDLPGGNVLYGETHIESLLKEIQEESSLSVKDVKPIFVRSQKPEEMGYYFLIIGYSCKALNDAITLSHEHTEFKWVTKNEFIEMDPSNVNIGVVKAA